MVTVAAGGWPEKTETTGGEATFASCASVPSTPTTCVGRLGLQSETDLTQPEGLP